jgi:hypothetical protein
MPRRPTRSQSDTPTRKELSRRLDDLGAGEDYDDVPQLTLCDVLTYETETVEEHAHFDIVRLVETGELRRREELDLGERWREQLETGPEE